MAAPFGAKDELAQCANLSNRQESLWSPDRNSTDGLIIPQLSGVPMQSDQDLQSLVSEHTIRYEIWTHYDISPEVRK